MFLFTGFLAWDFCASFKVYRQLIDILKNHMVLFMASNFEFWLIDDIIKVLCLLGLFHITRALSRIPNFILFSQEVIFFKFKLKGYKNIANIRKNSIVGRNLQYRVKHGSLQVFPCLILFFFMRCFISVMCKRTLITVVHWTAGMLICYTCLYLLQYH